MINFKNNLTKLDIPKNQAIYALIRNDEIIYIGSTDNLQTRVALHVYEGKDFDSFSYTLFTGRVDILSIEAEEILKHKPRLNKLIHSNPTWRSFDWFARKHFNGRVREFKKILMDQEIEAPYIFNSTSYYRIDNLSKILSNYLADTETNDNLGF